MPTLSELKASSPAYADLSDQEFASRVYAKHYRDKMSYDDFAQRTGAPSLFGNVRGGSHTEPANSNPVGRFLGRYGGRQVLQGIGGTLDMLGGHAFSQAVEKPLGLSEGESYREKFANVADQIGMRRPDTPQERVVSDVGEALTGAGLTMGIGTGLNALANMARSGSRPIVSRIGQLLSAQPGLQTVSTATGAGAASTARESGATGGQQALAGLVGGLAPGVTGATAAATARGLVRGSSGENMLQRIQDFASLGAAPSVGQASGSRAVQGLENLLAGGPTSTGVMARFAERQADDIGSGLQDAAEGISRNASAERAGRAIERGIHAPDGFTERFKAVQESLFNKLDTFIPQSNLIDVSGTRSAIRQMNAPIPGAPNVSRFFQNAKIQGVGSALEKDLAIPSEAKRALDEALSQIDSLYASRNSAVQDMGRFQAFAADQANRTHNFYPIEGMPRIPGRYSPFPGRASEGAAAAADAAASAQVSVSRAQQIETTLEQLTAAAAATDGRLPYEAIKKLRTLVGQEIDNAGLMSDFPRDKWKALYAALSRDLGAAAAEAGPQAEQAFRRANNYTKAGMDRVEMISRVIDKNGGPEKVFAAAMAGTRDGGTTLRAVMQSLPKEGQKALTAAVIKRMGLATPGAQDAAGDVFSAQTFLTNWNKVSPEARRALFDRYGPQFSKDMDRIARVAQNIKEGSQVFANPSGTANRGSAIGYWVSLLGALATGNPQVAGGLAAGGTVANAAARFMTTPWAVRWLANSTALPVGSAVSQAQALRQIAERNNDPEMVEIATVLEEQARNQQGGGNSGQQ